MNIREAIQNYRKQPIPYQVLLSLLQGYKRPNDKISSLVEEGLLIPVRRGLYVPGPAVKAGMPESFLIANHLIGPSYVSTDSALSHYGLIPEQVFGVTSVTTKPSRQFVTPIGAFSYTHLPLPYYSLGIRQEELAEQQHILIAGPEKALSDKIITTRGLKLRSRKNVMDYLLEDLRMEEEDLKELNTSFFREWLPYAPKAESLEMMIKTIKSL